MERQNPGKKGCGRRRGAGAAGPFSLFSRSPTSWHECVPHRGASRPVELTNRPTDPPTI